MPLSLSEQKSIAEHISANAAVIRDTDQGNPLSPEVSFSRQLMQSLPGTIAKLIDTRRQQQIQAIEKVMRYLHESGFEGIRVEIGDADTPYISDGKYLGQIFRLSMDASDPASSFRAMDKFLDHLPHELPHAQMLYGQYEDRIAMERDGFTVADGRRSFQGRQVTTAVMPTPK